MSGRRLGQRSLRWDAAYCAVTALLVLVLSPVLAPELGLSTAIVAGAAIVVGFWAAFLWAAPRRFALRPLLWVVLAVNSAAAALVGASAVLLSSVVLTVVLAAVALEVAAFAVSQALALRRLA